IAVACQSGANLVMSEAWPKHHTPRLPAVWIGAGLSVCWVMTSQPWSISALVASASLPGSYHEFTHTTRSEEHTSELQSLMRISYAVFCLKKKKTKHIKS